MEVLEGGELFDKIKESQFFSENKSRKITKEILEAVNYLHHQKIVHRDLKPENVLFDKNDILKIADFGTSKHFTKNMKKLQGTVYYIAPEVIMSNYNEKCDVWSIGVIMYILLCGYPPFNGSDNDEIMESVRNGKFHFK